ncbi:MAG: hypothetical protein NTZ69_09135 [Bacteroidia bacterium]|nr:hypothetical protein [Bacteroidia bacterium]
MVKKLLTVLLLLGSLLCKAQNKEGFALFTDRDLYTSGETLLIKVYAPVDEPSGIVNVDLFNSKGNLVSAVYLEMKNHQANGFIHLADSLSSGSYLVRTTTRTSLTQTVKELFVSNRFTGMTESTVFKRPEVNGPQVETTFTALQIEGTSGVYKNREKGHATVHLPLEFLSQIDGNLLVGITPVTPEYHAMNLVAATKPKFYRETSNEGIIISGTITDADTEKPFENGLVYLTIPDSLPEFKYYTTGVNGRFYFQITNRYGKIPVVLQCSDKEKKRLLKISLTPADNIFSSLPPGESHAFSPEFRKIVAKKVESLNFCKIFGLNELAMQPFPPHKQDDRLFYGIPNRVVRPKQFIDLPNFEEISRELLPQVKFRTYNRNPSLQLFNFQRNRYFNDQPLVLLNGIPVTYLNVIKEMGTTQIDRIDICQSERYFGDLGFSGVVAIYSTNGDYTRLNESDELIKLSLEAIQPDAELTAPPEHASKMPDLRQVLLWKPSLKPEKTLELNFQTSDIKGNYRIFLSGKSVNGSIFYKEQLFEVK